MRQRFQFKFWLDVAKPEERDLADHLETLKTKRQFSAAVRDGLRLIRDLHAGNVDELHRQFPWILGVITQSSSGDDSGDSGNNALLEKLESVERKLNELQQPGSHYQAPTLPSGNLSGLKQIAGGGNALQGPSDDDLMSLMEVKQTTDTGGQAAQNFINSLMALQSAPARTK